MEVFFFLLDTLQETVYLFLTNDKRAFQLFNRKTFLLFYRLAQHFITFIFHVKTLCVSAESEKKVGYGNDFWWRLVHRLSLCELRSSDSAPTVL